MLDLLHDEFDIKNISDVGMVAFRHERHQDVPYGGEHGWNPFLATLPLLRPSFRPFETHAPGIGQKEGVFFKLGLQRLPVLCGLCQFLLAPRSVQVGSKMKFTVEVDIMSQPRVAHYLGHLEFTQGCGCDWRYEAFGICTSIIRRPKAGNPVVKVTPFTVLLI